MLEYVKVILTKVSFDQKLLEKELLKATDLLNQAELNQLKDWCFEHFGKAYHTIFERCFSTVLQDAE